MFFYWYAGVLFNPEQAETTADNLNNSNGSSSGGSASAAAAAATSGAGAAAVEDVEGPLTKAGDVATVAADQSIHPSVDSKQTSFMYSAAVRALTITKESVTHNVRRRSTTRSAPRSPRYAS